jgi:hypothetical protein
MEKFSDTKPNYSLPVVGRLMSGEVVLDRPNSHNQLEQPLLEKSLSFVNSFNRDFMVEEVYLGEQVGYSTCVETGEEDEIVYAYRPHRHGPTRFVLNRDAVPTEQVTVILKRGDKPDEMILISAWAGAKAEPEPWDREAGANSDDFWRNHALIWGSVEIDAARDITRE